MPLSLDDMLPSERRLLAKLGGFVAPDVAIGCEVGELSADELLTALTMRLRRPATTSPASQQRHRRAPLPSGDHLNSSTGPDRRGSISAEPPRERR